MSKAKILAGAVSAGGVLADGAVSAAEVSGLAAVATSGAYGDLSGKPSLPAGAIVGTTDTQTLAGKTIDIASNTLTGVQPSLVSGTNIKTVGGQSVLGSGDLTVGGGSWVYLSTVTASGSSTADIETTFSSTYTTYMLVVSSIQASDNNATFECLMKIGGSYITTGTYFWTREQTNSSTPADAYVSFSSSSNSLIRLASELGNTAGYSVNMVMSINAPSSTSLMKTTSWVGTMVNNLGRATKCNGSGYNSGTAALTGLRFSMNAGTFSGTFRLYGIANS